MSNEFELCIDILMRKTNKTSARDQQTLADFLTRVQTFRGMCSKEELNERLVDIAKYLEFEEVEEGTAIFHKGEDSLYFYIILQGSVSVFIPKSAKDIDLEERWRKQLDRLIAEYGDVTTSGAKNGGLGISSSKSSVVNQINQAKNILKYLRCQEDEELLKSNNGSRYFRDDICTFKKIQKLGENESFGESILSSTEQQRTATLIASDGLPFVWTSKKTESENEGEIPIVETVEQQENKEKKVVLLAKVTKWNFLKVFQYELDKRSFIRKCLLSNYKNDLSDKVLDTLTFQFKEEHFEKGAHIVKQSESGNAISDQKMGSESNANKEDTKRRKGLHGEESNSESEYDESSPLSRKKKKQSQQTTDKKRGSMAGDQQPRQQSNSETEYLYLLYKGSIEVRQRIVTNSSKSQVKNIDSHILRQQVVAYANKVDVALAHLTESEFFGHENWFKEDHDRIFNNYEGDYSPDQAFKDKLIQMKKDFSIVVRETDTVVFKISRQFLSEEQNRLLLYSLIQHGKQRHNRYMQICKEVADKTDDTFQKQLKQQIEFLTQEKNQKLASQGTIQAPTIVIPTSQVGTNADLPFSGSSLSPRKTMNDIQFSPKNKLRSEADDSNIDNSPTCKIKLKNEFESFRKRFEGTYKITATQPILPSPEYAEIQFQQMQLQQLKRQSTISPAKSRRDNNESPQKRSYADLTMSPKKRSNEGSASPTRTAYDGGMSPSKRFLQDECLSPIKLRSQSPSKKSIILRQNIGNQDGSDSPTRLGDGHSVAHLSLGQIPEYQEGSEKNMDSSQNFPLVTLNHIQPSNRNDFGNETPIEDGFTAAYNNSPKKQLILRTLQRPSSMPNAEELDIVKRNGPSLQQHESCLNLEGGSPHASSPSRKSNQFQEWKTQQHSQQQQVTSSSDNDNFILPSVSSFFHEPFSETRKKIALQVAKSKMGGMTASLKVNPTESTTPARFAWPEPAETIEFSPKRKTEMIQEQSFSEQIPVFTKTVSVMNDNGQSLPSEPSFEMPLAANQINDRHNETQPKQQSTISKLSQLSIKLTKSKLTQQQSMTYEKNIPLLIKSLLQKKDSTVRTSTPVAANDNQEILPKKQKLSSSSSQPTLISLQNTYNLTKESGDSSASKPQTITNTTKNVVIFSKPNVSTPIKNPPVVPNLNLNTPPIGLEQTPENLKISSFRAPQHFHGRSLINLNKVQHDLNESAPIFMFPSSQPQKSQKLLTKSQHSLFDPHPPVQQQPQFSNLTEESQPYNLSQVQPSNPAQPTLQSQSSYQTFSLKNLKSNREITEPSPVIIPQQTFPQSNQLAQKDNKIKFLVTISNSSRIPSWQEKSSPVKGIPNQSMTSRSGQIMKGSQLYSINEAKKESLKNEFLRRKMAESSDIPELQQSLDSGFPKNKRQTNQISSENPASQHARIGSLQLQSTFNNNDNSNSSSNLGFQTFRNSETADGLTSQAFPSSNKAHSPAGSRLNSFYYQSQSSVSPAARLRKVQKHYAILSSSARQPESLSSQLQSSTFRQTSSQQTQMYQTKQQQANMTKNNNISNNNGSSSYLNLNLVPSLGSLFENNQSSQSQLIHSQPKRLQVMKPNIQPHQTLSQINQSIGKEASTQCPPNLLLKAEKKGIHPQRESFKTVGSETERGNLSRSNDREKNQQQKDFQQQQSLTSREEINTNPASDTFEKARIAMNMKKLSSFPKRAIFDQSPNKGLQARLIQSCFRQK